MPEIRDLAARVKSVTAFGEFSVTEFTSSMRLTMGRTRQARCSSHTARVLREGAVIAVSGIVAGALGGLLLTSIVNSYPTPVDIPGAVTITAAATTLITAAILRHHGLRPCRL